MNLRPTHRPEDVLEADLDLFREDLDGVLADMSGKRLLLTGGAGFLGYYLIEAVLDWNRRHDAEPERIRLTVFDNFARGRPPWFQRYDGVPGLTVETRSLSEPLPADLPGFSYVIHAAGIASPHVYREYPLETIDANIIGLRNLLDEARGRQGTSTPLEGFLYYSSSEIYGDPPTERIPTTEDYRGNVSCTGPRACYDESKRLGETLCTVFARKYELPVTIARPFNNYGPGLRIDDGRVIPDLARRLLAGEDLVLHSDGSPTRTFCYSADAVCGYYRVLLRGRPGEAYNVGVEAPEISMSALAEQLMAAGKELFGYTGAVVHRPSAEADYLTDNPQRRCPDITKARTELGYNPRVGLDDGLRRSLQWYARQAPATPRT